jgi:multicomponent Na+:H+ antiporter subunit B
LKTFAKIILIICFSVFLWQSWDFPDWGDPDSPASTHLSPYFIENTIKDSHVPNIVSAVLADYRSFDTMFETVVVFSAGLACFFLLRRKPAEEKSKYFRHLPTGATIKIEPGGKLPSRKSKVFREIDSLWIPDDLIIKKTCQYIIPFIQIFALYVVAHGHYSPGGGFQGGVILGATVILFAISRTLSAGIKWVSEKSASVTAAAGVLIYAGAGAVCVAAGKVFLNYEALAPILGTDKVMARSHGIFIVEIGVTAAVSAVMIWIYYNLSSAGKHDEGL